MSRGDRLVFVLLLVACLGAPIGGLLYVRTHRAAAVDARMEVRGTVIAKRAELPGVKQFYPVRFILIIQQSPGAWRSVQVDHSTYSVAKIGMRFARDSRGNFALQR